MIVAATEPEGAKIAAIHAQGLENGVEGLSLLDGAEARRLEPNLTCNAASSRPRPASSTATP